MHRSSHRLIQKNWLVDRCQANPSSSKSDKLEGKGCSLRRTLCSLEIVPLLRGTHLITPLKRVNSSQTRHRKLSRPRRPEFFPAHVALICGYSAQSPGARVVCRAHACSLQPTHTPFIHLKTTPVTAHACQKHQRAPSCGVNAHRGCRERCLSHVKIGMCTRGL